MSTSYKTVFVLSIVMIFVVAGSSSVSGTGASIGIFYWGYIAWKMYKRDNHSLVIFQRAFLWIHAILFFLIQGILLFSELFSDFGLILLVLTAVNMLISYGLLVFFKKYLNLKSTSNDLKSSEISEVEDQYWEAASLELAGARDEATWAKSFALSDGDEAKTKARYIAARAHQLMKNASVKRIEESPYPPESSDVQSTEVDRSSNSSDRSSLRSIIGLGAIGIFLVIFIGVLIGLGINNKYKGSEYSGTDSPNTNSSEGAPSISSNSVNPQSPASISVNRGSSWESGVAELKRGIKDGTFFVYAMSVELLENPFDIFDKPSSSDTSSLPSRLVAVIEEKIIWWIQKNQLYIRLYNPGVSNMQGLVFYFTDLPCTEPNRPIKSWIHLDLTKTPLSPYSYGVYSATLPFNYRKVIGDGVKCGIVEMALIRKN